MIRNRLLYLVALVSVTLFYGFFYGWFSEFVWYLILAMPLVSVLLSLPAILTARAELEAPASVTRNDTARATIRLRCGFFPTPRCKFRIEIVHTPSGTRNVYKYRPSAKTARPYELPTAHSGAICYHLSRIRVCDYLGIFAIPRKWELQGSTVVLPQPTPPGKLPNLTHLMSVALRPKPGGGFSEIHELREYRPGDSLRHIHWKLTAKTDRPVVREPQELCLGRLALSLDLPPAPQEFDQVLDRTAWLSAWLLERGFSHEVVWFSGEQASCLTVSQHSDLSDLVYALCLSQPTATDHSAVNLCGDASWRYHIAPDATDTEEVTEP